MDASPEVLAIDRIKNGADRVDYVAADLFDDLRERGWQVTVDNTSFAFIFGQGSYAQEQ